MKITKKQLQKLIREQVMGAAPGASPSLPASGSGGIVREDSVDDLEVETQAEELAEYIKTSLMGNPMPFKEKVKLLTKIQMIVHSLLEV